MAEIPTVIEKSLKHYLHELSQHYRLNRVILFASIAHGTSDRNSDIDLAIFSADITADNEIEAMADCLLRSVHYKLDIQPLLFPLSDYDADNDFIQKEIIARGIELQVPE